MAKEKSKNNYAVLKRILSYAKPYRRKIILALIFAIFYVGLNLTAPVLVGYAIDNAVDKGMVDFKTIGDLLLMVGITVICSSLFQWMMELCTNEVAYLTMRDMRRDIYKKFNSVPLRFIDGHPHGDLISRMINDVDSVGDGLLQGITRLFSGIVMIVCTLGFMIFINPVIALVVVLITPLSMFVAAFITRISQAMFREQSRTQGEISAYINEYVGGQKVVKAFGYEQRSVKDFEEINERLRVCGQKSQFYSSLANPSTRFVNGLVTAAVSAAGAISVIHGVISVGQIATFITYANQYTKPFNEVTGVIPQLQSALAGADRIFSVLDESNETPDAEITASPEKCRGQVDIENVSFSYVPEKPLIRDFNLHVKSGQRVAIVGPTGCGKTTLINLLMRFYDIDSGSIMIDGTGIYDITRSSLRRHYGMVLQESWLYNASIRDNIAYGKPDATLEEVKRAAQQAHIDRFIDRLPEGYDTVITEDGGNLSQGQRQLICIARVMLCQPPMLILDEATSSIDTRTEIKIQKAFNEMMKGRTCFVVAHRLSTIKESDIILVMKDGNIIEQGSHDELIRKGGFYNTLYNSQFAAT